MTKNEKLVKILSKFADKNPDMPFMFIAVTPDGIASFVEGCPTQIRNMTEHVKDRVRL
jgi:hypothetical protein